MNRYGDGGRFERKDLEQLRKQDERAMEQSKERDQRDFGQWQPTSHYNGRQRNPPVGHGVYLFIRFPGNSAEFAAQTVVLGKRTVLSYRGEFVGIARKIDDLSSGPRRPESLVMYLFESSFGAERFFVSDSRFKQHDFPPPAGACEAWTMVKFRDTRDEEFTSYRTYMLCYTTLTNGSFYDYRDRVNTPLGHLIEEYAGIPFVVQNVGVDSLRRHHIETNTMVTLHFFQSESDVYNLMRDPRYQEIKRVQFSLANDVTSVFTIDPEACP